MLSVCVCHSRAQVSPKLPSLFVSVILVKCASDFYWKTKHMGEWAESVRAGQVGALPEEKHNKHREEQHMLYFYRQSCDLSLFR